MIYFDSSYLIKCYLPEPGHESVRQLAREHPLVACCTFGKTECRSAVHRHFREGRLTRAQADTVFQVMDEDDKAQLWQWLELTATIIDGAADAFRTLSADVFLRTADSLHLACARVHGLEEIYSNDRHLLGAASHFGIAGKNILDQS
jgi:predicted nucleic acid-binding protein